MAEENEKTVNTFAIVEGWIDEIDESIDDLYYQIETMGETQ